MAIHEECGVLSTKKDCQSVEVNHQKGKMALDYNGNISNSIKLRDTLELSGAIFHTTSDTETIAEENCLNEVNYEKRI